MRLPCSALRSSTERQSAGHGARGPRQRCRIVGVDARHDVQHVGEIGDRARHRAAEVRHPDQRLNAGAALEAVGAAQRHQALRRSRERRASRRSAIPSPRPRSFPPRRWPNRRSTRAATSTGLKHVPHLPPRVVGPVAERRVLLQRRLADDHGARLAQPGHLERVARREESLEREAAVGRRPCRRCRSCS